VTPAGFACAWCERVRSRGGEWEDACPDELRLSSLVLGICPECLRHETGAALATGVVLSLKVLEGR
jgi:hypothetical protein